MFSRKLIPVCLQALKSYKNQQAAAFCSKNDMLAKTPGGEYLPKDHRVFEAIGNTEELLSYLGLAREFSLGNNHDYSDKLKRIQTVLIEMSNAMGAAPGKATAFQESHTEELEEWIQEYEQALPPVEHFLVPGGGMASSTLLVARSICRRTERTLVPLIKAGQFSPTAYAYLNRLSDFLFAASRMAAKIEKRTESIYTPKQQA